MFDDQPEYDVYYDSPMDQETPVVHDDYNPAAHPDWRNELSFPGPSSAGHMFQSATHVGFHGSQEFNNVAGNLNIYPTTTYAMPLGSNNSPYTGTPHLQALSVENPPLSTSRDALGSVCSDSASYCSHLLRQGRGFPLYVPGPQKNLPEEYRRTGITIGDVGRITPEGVFDFFFNIYLDGDHAVNADFVPGDFSPLRRSIPRDIINVEFDPGNYVASAFIQAWDPNAISGEFPGSEFLFSCQGPSGAVLALPHGARLEKLEDVEHVRQYAACHAESWYKYINGTRGRALTNGSLYLITGCEKSASGGIASFQNVAPGAEFQLSFRPTAHADDDYRYRFVRGTPARTKHFDVSARSDEGTLNQTTFLHGFSISLGEGIWGRLFGVKVREIADSEMQDARSDFVPFGLQGSLSSWSFNFFGGGSGAGGEKYTDNTGDELTMSDFVPTSVVVHPGQLINTCLLRECPEARVVITHDDDWRDVLRDDGTEAAIKDTTELLAVMFEQSTLKEEDGLIFLVSKSEELTLPSMLPWVPSAGKLSARASEPSGRDSHVSEAPRKGRLHPSSTRHSSVQYSASSVMDLPELEAVSSSSTAPSRYGSGYHDPPLDLPSDGAANLPYKSIEKFRVESHLSMTLPAWDSDFGEPLAVDPPARHPGASIEGVGHSLPAHREARSTRRNKPEMFICEICGNTFTARHNLKNHINSHNSVKVFKCEDCGQSFGTAAVLNRHKRNCRGSREESEYRRRQTELRRLGF